MQYRADRTRLQSGNPRFCVAPLPAPPDLHKIGGLPVLLELLESPHASLRWRAAEVVATCVANNPPVQEVGGIRVWGTYGVRISKP